MKKVILTKSILFLSLIILITACNTDDPALPSISVNDFSATVDENQSTGTVLGSIDATGTDGTFTYSISNQTPTGALSIDTTTGSVTVANENAFDFEANPTITANVSVTGATITETITATITLNNIDDIEFFLNASQSDYTAATDGDWILITENEYNNLASNLNEITKVAATDDNYNLNTTIDVADANFTMANDNGATIPNNSYLVAFKYNATSNNVIGVQVKQSSTSVSEQYMDLGGNLPIHNTGNQFFVLKGNNNITTNIGYLAIYESNGIGFIMLTGSSVAFNEENVNILLGVGNNLLVLYQGLSTTQKQW